MAIYKQVRKKQRKVKWKFIRSNLYNNKEQADRVLISDGDTFKDISIDEFLNNYTLKTLDADTLGSIYVDEMKLNKKTKWRDAWFANDYNRYWAVKVTTHSHEILFKVYRDFNGRPLPDTEQLMSLDNFAKEFDMRAFKN